MGDITISEMYNFLVKIVAVIGVLVVAFKYAKSGFNSILKPLNGIEEKVDKLSKEVDVVSSGLKSSLRQSILKSCEDYIYNGACTMEQHKSLVQAYEDYEKLVGENGVVTDLYTRAVNLPIKEEL